MAGRNWSDCGRSSPRPRASWDSTASRYCALPRSSRTSAAAPDVEQAHKFALEKFAQELLPVRDSLELAAASAATADAASLAAGQDATLKLLARAFEKFAVNAIDPVGEPFDPQRHEAMAMQPSATAEPDSVLQVVQRGYELNGRLLRPARVIVARSAQET
jgi:molecular chaperone GrpE